VVSMDGCNTSPKGEVDAEETEEEAARLHGSGAGRGIWSLATRRVVSWNRPGV